LTFCSLFPGATETIAADINNSGNIVGTYSLGGSISGFLDKGGTFSTITFPGAKGTEAYGINDQGDLVGAYTDQSGIVHGFEAAPVPEPTVFVLFVTGLVAAASWRGRRLVAART
jgi:uncharacterized membrane protein